MQANCQLTVINAYKADITVNWFIGDQVGEEVIYQHHIAPQKLNVQEVLRDNRQYWIQIVKSDAPDPTYQLGYQANGNQTWSFSKDGIHVQPQN